MLLTEVIPLLSIQPLVENAVIHGIQHLSEGGQITVKVKQKKKGFQVLVSNPYKADKIQPGTHTGIDNIRQRLALAYGDKVNMSAEAGDQFVAIWEVNL